MPQHLTEQANGSTVALQVGERFDLSLAANLTTGYRWELTAIERAIVTLAGEPDYDVGSNMPGAGGIQTFHFVTAAAGQTLLKLIYHRPFETNTPPLKTVELTVLVQ